MAKKVAISNLNATTLDILNTIRANASGEYQQLVPIVEKATDIPVVGQVFEGYPALANQFLTTLLNRIALVRVKSATFNNPYSRLKKGYLEFGETVEEIFVNIAEAYDFSAEKAEQRELKRHLPDVRTAFHAMNWRVQYPVTIQNEDLRQAFTSADGVTELIAKIVDAVYTAGEYDEYLLFKYLIIKGATHGAIKVTGYDGAEIKNSATAFRSASNKLTFMSSEYNNAGVRNVTPRDRQIIFMDSDFNARFDVEVLASAFNMGKADFIGSLYLIDDFTTFDNDRFKNIIEANNSVELVTDAELELMKGVKAVILDSDWFQIYDNLSNFTEKYVASGLYWNYFYNNWKTISYSPYANAIMFVDNTVTVPQEITEVTAVVTAIDTSDAGNVYTLTIKDSTTLANVESLRFVQTAEATEDLIAIHPYGGIIIPKGHGIDGVTLEVTNGKVTLKSATKLFISTVEVGTEFTLTKA